MRQTQFRRPQGSKNSLHFQLRQNAAKVIVAVVQICNLTAYFLPAVLLQPVVRSQQIKQRSFSARRKNLSVGVFFIEKRAKVSALFFR